MRDSAFGQGEPGDSAAPGDNGSGWRETGEEFESLRSSFRESYREGAGGGPSRHQVADAFGVLAGAIAHMVAGAGNTLKDPAVKKQVQKTTRTAATAINTTVSEWAAELRSRLDKKPESRQGTAGEGDSSVGQDPPGP